MSEYDDFDTTLDDAAEWGEASNKWEEEESKWGKSADEVIGSSTKEKKIVPGQPSQYALYGAGYMATTPTVSVLPPGSYDIHSDSNGVYAVPSIKSSGLLLELPEMRSDEVIRLVELFWNSEKDYKDGNEFVVGGALFKAGVMIYGPPGSGKSCTIKIVSNKLVARGGIVFFAGNHPTTVMGFLEDFARVEPDRKSIVILEDIDSLIAQHGEARYLEMLDSAKTISNVLFIATTNYPERLDPRIYNRPGRFSSVVKIGLPGPLTREAYLKAILKDYRDVPEIVKKTEGFTIDHLTALINAVYREKKELAHEIERLRILFKAPIAGEGKGLGIGVK